MPKVAVLTGSGFKAVCDMFKSEGWELTNDIDDADLVQFVGGADVSPSLYEEYMHSSTRSDPDRDEVEQRVYNTCIDLGIPMAGICRGGQFLNVMNGGRMYQDVDGHTSGNHQAWVMGALLPVTVTSTHHQMMDPNFDVEQKILLTAGESTRKWSMASSLSSMKYERVIYPEKARKNDVEAVYYPGTRSLCFQPHPEFSAGVVQDTKDIYFMFIEQYLFGGLERIEEQAQA